jgi:uncharacterized membrane protein
MIAYTLPSSQSGMKAWLNSLLWALVAISGIVQMATGLFHDIGPPAVQAATLTLPLLAFAFAHGSVVYGWRDMIVFAIICLAVSNAIENLNILTGLPSGHYHYTDLLGPKLLLVPVVIGPAYFGVGYLAWMLARLVLGDAGERRPRHATFTVPLVASFVMVAWNLSFDALYATVRQFWIWKDGGSYFGVPIANSFGWLLTTYLFFQLYALYLRHRENGQAARVPQSSRYWLQPVIIYGGIAGMVVLCALTTTTTEHVRDQAGTLWRIRDIYAVCALVCCFTMGAFTLLGLVKISELHSEGCGGRERVKDAKSSGATPS